ncbi:hypothetical protein D9M73_210380 [compost metagenome]
MALRLHLQGVGEDAGAAVRRRAQTDDLRAEVDLTVVAVMGDVMQCDMDRHSGPPASLDDSPATQDLCRHPNGALAGS